MLTEEADKCFENLSGAEDTARFMTITFDCKPKMVSECAGVTHIDDTARPQIVSRSDNASYYDIIRAYYEKTGLPCIVNTSYNMPEEPIVCTPQDAVRAFLQGNLDCLAMGSFVALNEQAYLQRTGQSLRTAT